MIRSQYILALDQGTTGSRAVLFDHGGRAQASAYKEFPQIFPKPGWVEHEPECIWLSVRSVINSVISQAKAGASSIASIGITNQRETTVLWDRKNGKPIANAIVWQDRRTDADCERLRAKGHEKGIRSKTGLVLDPYFSATKIAWMLEHIPGLRRRASRGEILFGTVDSWLLWKLTGGKVHATDPTNASRTLLFNIHTRKWDPELLHLFKIPRGILPEVRPSGSFFGETAGLNTHLNGIRIESVLGDQQAALYGQSCYAKGQLKNTYGTGCFVMANLGSRRPVKTPQGLLVTLACDQNGDSVYALEGAVFIGGAVIQWIRDGLKIISQAGESERFARAVKDTGGVTFIPAFTGLGSPYWDSQARGMISGMTRGTTRNQIIRAALESIAHQSADVIEAMKIMTPIRELKVDGGATRNSFLMQFQADILQLPLRVSSKTESTAWGAAKLAGVVSGFWENLKLIDRKNGYKRFNPQQKGQIVRLERERWAKEIQRVRL